MEENELTDKELLKIANQRREELRASQPPIDTQATVTESTKPGTRQAKKDKKAGKEQQSNRWEGPDKDFIKIRWKFIEAVYKQYLRLYESKVLWFLVRKTWGWRVRSEFIPLKQFEKGLDILKPHISRALSSLVKRRIVTKLGNKRYAIQSDTSLWQDKPRKSRAKKRKLSKK